eukprot:COSAG05_NODE_141_length_16655_cov_22.580963_6_plen_179_part_00
MSGEVGQHRGSTVHCSAGLLAVDGPRADKLRVQPGAISPRSFWVERRHHWAVEKWSGAGAERTTPRCVPANEVGIGADATKRGNVDNPFGAVVVLRALFGPRLVPQRAEGWHLLMRRNSSRRRRSSRLLRPRLLRCRSCCGPGETHHSEKHDQRCPCYARLRWPPGPSIVCLQRPHAH